MERKLIDFLYTDQIGILWWKTVNLSIWKALENIKKDIFVFKIIQGLYPTEILKSEDYNSEFLQ